jgi:hypothetical protein
MHRLALPLAAFAWLIMQSSPALAAAEDSLAAALAAARADADIPFNLRVDCTERDSRRSLAVIGGTVAVWDNERQVRLSTTDRDALIDLLLEADFAHFAARYGETPKADKQEAPLRVSCRIHVALQGMEKASVQLLDGEQSEQLLGLARQLLDRVEPLAADGVTAASLEDGLAKLADGTLAPEALGFRFLTLPDAGDNAPGRVLRVEGGLISRQHYAPGKSVGPVQSEDLAQCQLQDIIAALRDARFWELPVNLYADELTELEVHVLSQRKTVIARSTFNPAPVKTQTAFAGLLTRLANQPSACDE